MDPRVKPGGDESIGGDAKPLLLVEKLVKEYPRQGATASLGRLFSRKPPVEQEVFRAVDGISFTVGNGESVGLVGESGCGKSTTSMMVMRLLDQTSGRIVLRRRGDRQHHAQRLCAAAAAQPHPDGVPGSDRQPQPALHRGARDCRPDPAARRHQGARRLARPLRGTGGAGRASDQPAGSVSASIVRRYRRPVSASPAPLRCTPSWWCSTSRPRRSMSRCRRWS